MLKHLDVAVCGCGPAGLAAALLLQKAGHNVRIFERFLQPQPVGSGLILQPTGLAVLDVLGLAEKVSAAGAAITRLFGRVQPSGRVVLDVRYAAMGAGWRAHGIHRSNLFDSLFEAAVSARIPISTGVEIFGSKRLGGKTILFGKACEKLGSFDLVVDALGARSALRPSDQPVRKLAFGALWANVDLDPAMPMMKNALEQRYFRAEKMAGVLPLGRKTPDAAAQAAFFWSLRCADLGRWQDAGIENWRREVGDLWPECRMLVDQMQDLSQLTFAQYEHFTMRRPWGEGLVHIGDAAHCTSPQLGQGCNMGLLDALALSIALERGATLDAALKDYGQMRRWHVRLFQYASAIFTPFYQSDGQVLPWLRDWIAAPASRLPVGDLVVAKLVSGLTVAPLAGHDLRIQMDTTRLARGPVSY